MSYTPPLDDIRFTLHHIVRLADMLGDEIGSDDVDAVLEEAGRFAADVLAPLNHPGDRHGARLDAGIVRTAPGFAAAYRQFVEMGWNGIAAPADHGGQGLPTVVATAVGELWHSANMAWALCPMLTQGAIDVLERYGSPEQRETYLAKLVSGAWTGTMCLTEPQAGSDVGALRSKAVRDGGAYRITGQKIYITYGDHDYTDNIIHMVLARTPEAPAGTRGISLFLVPKLLPDGSANDLHCVSLEHKLGIHASPTAVMAFGDGGGATGWLIGEENRGMEYMFAMMNAARLAVGLQGVAIAERAYQQARDYARGRIQGKDSKGQPAAIIQHPDIRRLLMLAKVRIDAVRALAYEAAIAIDRGKQGDEAARLRADLLIPVVKAWSTDLGVEIASVGIQIHGGMGYVEETGAAQHYRDARIAPIYEGTNGIQALDLLGRKVIRDKGAALFALTDEIERTAIKLGGLPGDDCAIIAAALSRANGALRATGLWLIETSARDAAYATVGASDFLSLLGTVAGGWLVARGAIAATEWLRTGGGNAAFLDGKLIAARCYAEHVMPVAALLETRIKSGAVSLLTLDERLF